ncbi:MAG: DUF411 domain-containing protein [Sedimenticola sp.]
MKLLLIISLALFSSSLFAGNPEWKKRITDKRYDITVYRSASCGCCTEWINHLKEHNFNINDVTVNDVNHYKTKFGVPPQAASCHTAVVDGITIEGHVPAQDIKRLLAEKSDVRLLTVPGMPSGTPGMDMPGSPKDKFKVYSINQDNEVGVYNSYANY